MSTILSTPCGSHRTEDRECTSAPRRGPGPQVLAFLLLMPCLSCASESVSTASLLEEMVDIDSLCLAPHPSFATSLASSYDRRSSTRDDAGSWFANGDSGGCIRTETRGARSESVLLDAAGPGCIVRIWSANPAGTVRIYLDGAAAPTIEMPFADMLLGGPLGIPDPLARMTAKGYNLYFPIPYEKSCKLTVDSARGLYYHINHRTYPQGTKVDTFAMRCLADLAPLIQSVARRLEAKERPLADGQGRRTDPFALALRPGETATIATVEGQRAINSFALQWEKPAGGADDPRLRAILLRASFDGTESVVCPLGDFFGGGPGVHPFQGWTTGVSADGRFESRWPMPFARKATITVENRFSAPVTLIGETTSVARPWTDRSFHFNCRWRNFPDLPTASKRDLPWLRVRGAGVLLGAAMTIDNPNLSWWGEGDEKILVDGEAFPSWFGTGTEDFFGYAWCDPTPFSHPFHSQVRCDGPWVFGRTAANRLLIIDRVPFKSSLAFDMELWHCAPCSVTSSAVLWWYAAPGSTSDEPADGVGDLVLQPAPKRVTIKVQGVMEAETMRTVAKTGKGESYGQAVDEPASDGAQYTWCNGLAVGDTLELAFRTDRKVRGRISGRFMVGPRCPIVSARIDRMEPSDGIDLSADRKAFSGEITLAEGDWEPGEHHLTVRISGSRRQPVSECTVGIDFLRLVESPDPR